MTADEIYPELLKTSERATTVTKAHADVLAEGIGQLISYKIWWCADSFFRLSLEIVKCHGRAMNACVTRNLSYTSLEVRNLLELWITCTYCAKSIDNAVSVRQDIIRDLYDWTLALKHLSTSTTLNNEAKAKFQDLFEPIEKQIAEIAIDADMENLTKKDKSLVEMARDIGGDTLIMYTTYNKALSKFIHPTSFLIYGPFEGIEAKTVFCDYFLEMGRRFIIRALDAIEHSAHLMPILEVSPSN